MNKKTIVKKLLSESLQEEERKRLIGNREVEQQMFHQWSTVPDKSAEADEQHIWSAVCKRTISSDGKRNGSFYKFYSLVASILLLISIGGIASLWMSRNTLPHMYVVASGIQNLEKIQLPDGTNVCLGPGSRLEYPEAFTASHRDIRLSGQAFFDVAKNPEKPFRVQMDDVQVEALGTAFELFNYDDADDMEAVLVNGKIKVEHKINSRLSQITIMSPNEKLTLNKETGKAQKGIVHADKYTAWKSGILSFKNENLSMIIPRLERWYGREIICDEALLNNYRFTFKVRDESLETILSIMRQSAPLNFEKEKNENYILTLKR